MRGPHRRIIDIKKVEYIGKSATVLQCPLEGWTGRRGVIRDETKRMFLIEAGGDRGWLPKHGLVLDVDLPSGTARLNADTIPYRPEDRIKRAGGRHGR